VPTFPLAVAALETTGAATVTVSVKVFVPVPAVLVARSVTADVAAAVGVPEINPVAVLIVSPAGSPVALYDVAPPVAVI
jgi:hypothetical protein